MASKNLLFHDVEDYKIFVEINSFSTFSDFVRSRFCRRKRIPLTFKPRVSNILFPFQWFLEYMGYYKKGNKDVIAQKYLNYVTADKEFRKNRSYFKLKLLQII